MEEMKIIAGDKRIREWQLELGSRVWPEFMQHDETVSKYWMSLYEKFSDYQFAVFEDYIIDEALIPAKLIYPGSSTPSSICSP